ncbi:MAG: sarcosine oxidase subunit gamma family protein [Lentilitoribacter sp.]
MSELTTSHPLDHVTSTHKISNDDAELCISVRKLPALIQLFAKKEHEAELFKKLNFQTIAGKGAETDRFTALPIAPRQWILISKDEKALDFSRSIAQEIGKHGYVSEQSDSRVCIRISGKYARELLSRGCRLDLHPSVASPGFCAQTPIAQIGVLLHQVDALPTYDFYIYSGFAHSFWHWLDDTAKQFGEN